MISFTFSNYIKILEKKDLEQAINTFNTVVYKYSLKTLAKNNIYHFNINCKTKEMEVITRYPTEYVIEKNYLPKKLKYLIICRYGTKSIFEFNTKTNNNLSDAFSIYICNYSDYVTHRISFYTFQQNHIFKINTYRSTKKLKYKDLERIYWEGGDLSKGWIKI